MRVFTSGSPGAAKPFLGAKINVGKNVDKKKGGGGEIFTSYAGFNVYMGQQTHKQFRH